MNLLNILSLKDLKGSRTQWTIVVYGAINFLASIGVLHLSADDLSNINQFLTWAGTYFFAEKLSGGAK